MAVDFTSLRSISKGIAGVPGVSRERTCDGRAVAESGPGSTVNPVGVLSGDEGGCLAFSF